MMPDAHGFFEVSRVQGGRREVFSEVQGKRVRFSAAFSRDVGRDSSLVDRWKQCVGGELWWHVQQLGQRPSYIGVASSDPDLGRAFARELICGGRRWLELCRRHHLFLVERDRVRVWVGERMRVSVAWGDWATGRLLVEVLKERERLRADRAHSSAAMEELGRFSGDDFLVAEHGRVIGGGGVVAMAELGGRCVVVYGEMELCEARGLVREIMGAKAWLEGELGHVAVERYGRQLRVRTQFSGIGSSRGQVEVLVAGFLRLVVISDLHMGVSGRDTFGKCKAVGLVRLLERAARERSTVVMNGDFLELHHEFYGEIRRSYGEVFEALSRVRRVVYIAGNHDEDVLHERTKEIRRWARRRARRNVRARVVWGSGGLPKVMSLRPGIFGVKHRRLWLRLFRDPGVEQWLREVLQGGGGQVFLSSGFDREGVAFERTGSRGAVDEGQVWYLDESLVRVRRAAEHLLKLVGDRRQRLDRVIRADLGGNVSIVRYYSTGLRGLYFEHGHAAVPSCHGLNLGRYVAALSGWVKRLGVRDIEHLVEERIGDWVRGVYPFARVREINQFIQRALALGYWLREGEEGGGAEVRLIFGHTHEEAAAAAAPVDAFVRVFAGVSCGNSGAWTSRLRHSRSGRTSAEWLEIDAAGGCGVGWMNVVGGVVGSEAGAGLVTSAAPMVGRALSLES